MLLLYPSGDKNPREIVKSYERTTPVLGISLYGLNVIFAALVPQGAGKSD